MKTKHYIAIASLIILSSCAKVTPIDTCITTEPYGFWYGLWHGVIYPFSFVISLFDDTVAMYGVNNSGHLYDLGFILGASVLTGSGSRFSFRRRM